MRFLLVGLVIISFGLSLVGNVEIVNYQLSHKDQMIELAFQNNKTLFGGDHATMSREVFDMAYKKMLLSSLGNDHKITKVLIDSNRVIGFIIFFKTMHKTVRASDEKRPKRSIINRLLFRSKNSKVPHRDQALGKIEALVIAQDARQRGHGRALLQHSIIVMKQLWPAIRTIRLNVRPDNRNALKFYESEGFVRSVDQKAFSVKNMIMYEKHMR